MLNAHHKWKYFEPIEIVPVPADFVNETPHRSSAIISAMRQEIQVLRRSLDLLLDENERLYLAERNRRTGGCAEKPRAQAQLSAQGDARPGEKAKAHSTISSQSPRGVGNNSSDKTQENDGSRNGTPGTESSIDELSRIVVRWIFPAASEPRARLVAAAIRNRLATEE